MMMGCNFVLQVIQWMYILGIFFPHGQPNVVLADIKREKVARISPYTTTSSSSKSKSGNRGKGKKGSLNLQELQRLGLNQVSTLNISFFEDDVDTSNMIYTWTSSVDGDDSTSWYGEAINGVGSITVIRPCNSSRIVG